LSGLFGVLSPMDLIFPYRLEMGTKLKVGQDKNLYEFWGNKITDYLSELGSEYLINCASEEYFSVINPKKLKQKIITPVFLNKEKGTNRKYKTIGIFAKKARGMFARFIIQEKIKTISLLKDFNLEGYIFDKSESTEDRPVFKREYKRKS
jgi:cytoplasmic iron level regulating protein YaaA (DUF328/UPF0246 family)